MCNMKPKATDEQTQHTDKTSQTCTTVWQLPEGRGVRGSYEQRGSNTGDGRRFDFGWWAHYAKDRLCTIEMDT